MCKDINVLRLGRICQHNHLGNDVTFATTSLSIHICGISDLYTKYEMKSKMIMMNSKRYLGRRSEKE